MSSPKAATDDPQHCLRPADEKQPRLFGVAHKTKAMKDSFMYVFMMQQLTQYHEELPENERLFFSYIRISLAIDRYICRLIVKPTT